MASPSANGLPPRTPERANGRGVFPPKTPERAAPTTPGGRPVCMVMAYIAMNYIVMAYIVMAARREAGVPRACPNAARQEHVLSSPVFLYSCGLYSYGLYSCSLYRMYVHMVHVCACLCAGESASSNGPT